MIVYNGKDLSDYGVNAVGRGTYGAPSRDIEVVHVPGRNGDLLFDNGCFNNTTVEYPDCSILDNFPVNFRALVNFLMSSPGYHRLEDDYNPDEYRLARFIGPLAPDVHTARNNRSGTFPLQFDCQPQRWLKAGEQVMEIPLMRSSGNVRIFFTDSTRDHIVKISGNMSTLTYTLGSTSHTLSGNSHVIQVPSGYGYMDVTANGIRDINYDNSNIRYDGWRIYIKNTGDFEARPLWIIKPGVSTFTFTAGTAEQAADPYRYYTKIQAANPSYDYYIDTETYAIYKTDGTTKTNAAAEISGDVPVFPSGEMVIYCAQGDITADTRLRMIARTWRL